MKLYQIDEKVISYLCCRIKIMIWQKKTCILHPSPVMKYWTGFAA